MVLISFDHNLKTCNEEEFLHILSYFNQTANFGPCLSVIVFSSSLTLVLHGFVFFQGFKDSGSLYFECYIEESGAEGETSAEVYFHVVLLLECTIDGIFPTAFS